MDSRLAKVTYGALTFLVLLPVGASAQSFAGVVRDDSGGVLPGVTVEAASPALIEKARTVTTDGEGRYQIVDLRPGLYTLTFSLTGFSSVLRPGLELAAGTVVTINADLKVGSLEESITVSGQTPVVDVQQAARTQVLTRNTLDSLPTAKTFNSIAQLAPALRSGTPDVGGSMMTNPTYIKGHGVSQIETTYLVDGFMANLYTGNLPAYFNEAVGSEVSIMTSAIPAETAGGGYRQSYVLRDGGNSFSASSYAAGTAGSWIAENVSDEMRARGTRQGNRVTHLQLLNFTLGGPVMTDRLWFLVGGRHGSSTFRPPDQPDEVTLPSGDTLTTDSQDYVRDWTIRLTGQITQTVKATGYFQRSYKKYAFVAAGMDPAAAMVRDPGRAHEGSGNLKMTWTPSSRILVEGGFGTAMQHVHNGAQFDYLSPPRFTAEWYALARRTDTALNFSPLCSLPSGCTTWGGATLGATETTSRELKASVSYVTGSHNIKVGMSNRFGPSGSRAFPNADLTQSYAAGRPNSVTVQNSPVNSPMSVRLDLGVFAQDSWTINRLTVSPGVRIQWFESYMRPAYAEQGRFVPARAYPELKISPRWGPDVAPRIAVAYDVFGDGKTALKGNVSRYYQESVGIANLYSAAGSQTDSRNWFDCNLVAGTSTCSALTLPTNGDDIAQDNEIGPSSNPNFGLTPPRSLDPDNQRPYTWEYSVGVQREVLPRLSVTAMYYRRTWGDLPNTDRTLLSAADYTSFQAATPSVAQDPDVAAVVDTTKLVTVYNLNASKRSSYGVALVDGNAPDNKSIYTSLEVGFSARFGAAGTVFGNWALERNISVFCANDDNPNGPAVADQSGNSGAIGGAMVANGGRFCDQRNFDMPFQSQFKLAGNVPVKYGIQAGVVWQSIPGRQRDVTWTVPANLFPGGRTNAETIILNEPGSLYLPQWNQVDFNLRKVMRFGRHEFTGEFGLYNAFNSAVILSTIDNVGTSLGVVQQTLNGRTPRIGVQYKF